MYFPTWTAGQLLAALNKALDDQASGRTIVGAGAGSTTSQRQIMLELDERIRRLRHDLSVLDPETYAPEDYIPVERTKAVFS